MGEQIIVWITLALVVTLSGSRTVIANPRPEIGVGTEECANNFTSCFCNTAHALDYALICDVFSSFILKNSTLSPISVQPEITELTLYIINDFNGDEIRIPSYLLAEVEKLTITCSDNALYLIVDESSFEVLHFKLIYLEILGCNLDKFTFTFLGWFPNIQKIKLHQTTFPTSTALESIPRLEKWRVLEITYCTGMLEWSSSPSIESLLELNLGDNLLGDDAVMDILDSALMYNSDLEVIKLRNNSLTEVPAELIASFPSLMSFDLSHNFITHLPRGSLNISSITLKLIELDYLTLGGVDPEAFQGYFGETTITLRQNNLRAFECAAFKHILDQMAESNGRIDIRENPIECDCTLTWLIKDHRNLLSHVYGGRCSNSTSFEALNPAGWWECDAGTLPTFSSDDYALYEDLNLNYSTDLSTPEKDFTEDTTISSQHVTTSEYEVSVQNNIEVFTSPLPLLTTAEIADVGQTILEEIVDYLDTASTSTPNADYIPEDEMLLFFDSTATTENQQEYASENVYSLQSTEEYYKDQTVPSSTLQLALEDLTTGLPPIVALDATDNNKGDIYFKSTEVPFSGEAATYPTFFGDYSTTSWTVFSSTPSYSTEGYNFGFRSEDDVSSSRPYPILVNTGTTTLQPEGKFDLPPMEDETLVAIVGADAVPTTRGPNTGEKNSSWLERDPIVGSLIMTWLILLPIALSGIVYICG